MNSFNMFGGHHRRAGRGITRRLGLAYYGTLLVLPRRPGPYGAPYTPSNAPGKSTISRG
jgi:hypothetical protein